MVSDAPLFSVLVPVWHPDLDEFRQCIDSVLAQTFPDWELLLVADGPQPESVVDMMSHPDPRVRPVFLPINGGISHASNGGIKAARGEFVALLDNDDVLAPFALEVCAEPIRDLADVDVVYTDEDKLDMSGRRYDPYFKPAWSPERLLGQQYLGHLTVYRRSLVNEVGGFRPEFDGAQDYDLALRATSKARRIVHIPRICYHWRATEGSVAASQDAKPWAFAAGVRAVHDHLTTAGHQVEVSTVPGHNGLLAITPHVGAVAASIVIPSSGTTKQVDGREVLLPDTAIQSMLHHNQATGHDLDIIVVLDRNATEASRQRIQALDPQRVVIVQDDQPFNFSRASNLGAVQARHDLLVFLNDDTQIINDNWLERVAFFARQDGVGAVGCKLIYGDGRIQHVGLFGHDGGIHHRSVGLPGDLLGHMGEHTIPGNVVAVTGAFLALQRDRYVSVGGFTETLPYAFNDVDLCLKLFRRGYRNVIDNQTVLVHHESTTRDPTVNADEVNYLHRVLDDLLRSDPYHNPNFFTAGPDAIAPPIGLVSAFEHIGSADFSYRAWPFAEHAWDERDTRLAQIWERLTGSRSAEPV